MQGMAALGERMLLTLRGGGRGIGEVNLGELRERLLGRLLMGVMVVMVVVGMRGGDRALEEGLGRISKREERKEGRGGGPE